jgi:phosphoenolpyruvate phosphomutase
MVRKLLRERLGRPEPVLIAGAHTGLSAKLVEEAGFDGVWASGFEISASHGVPDANILTMREALDAAEQMARVIDIPIVADCDNGYGNAINVIHTVREYERAGIAAICIEDNIFPKRCSFYAGVRRELAEPEEHAGKIKACLDTRTDDDFLIIARTEALIAGWGMEEALLRGRMYADAGADMVLIHSKSPSPAEVLEFASHWDRETPLVCVPTIYKETTAQTLGEAGFKLIIYANHGLRSSIKAMREAFRRIMDEKRASAADELVVPLTDVYGLIGVDDMKREEKCYLPAGGAQVGAIVLAAGASPELGDLTADRPKAMLDIKGKTILARQVEALNAAAIKDVAAVIGWKHEAVDLPNLKTYVVEETSGELDSLMAAADGIEGRTVVLYGDLLFDRSLLERLLQADGDVVLVVDRAETPERAHRDLVETSTPPETSGRFLPGSDVVKRIGVDLDGANGEWIGMLMLSPEGAKRFREHYETLAKSHGDRPLHQAKTLHEAALTDFLQSLIDAGLEVRTVDTYKGWMEVDTFEDYRRAWGQID